MFMSGDLVQQIQKTKAEQQGNNKVAKKITYLIFATNGRFLAFPSNAVKEILKGNEVFPVPFVPPYINGILNRYGDPYAVIDIAPLIGETEQKTSLFAVLNDESHSCLKITDVKEFYNVTENEIIRFAENDLSEFFDGSLKTKYGEVFIINLKALLKKVERDFATI